ncbi:heterokaryon incompatibility protein-domain-containing protein [Diaporthe sp. PMI_573]|nr:heterokaryon incompatibility protein-domain-containing protein [Diaporthaceae sp. PMI_573]
MTTDTPFEMHECLEIMSNELSHDFDFRSEIEKYQPPWVDIIMRPKQIPESWFAVGAVKFEAGREASAAKSHPRQKLRHGGSSKYRYTPFNDESNHIRMIHLLPGQRDDPIRIHLEPCSLDSRPYEAISYVWGDRSDNAVIIVSESQVDYAVDVPQRLHGALKKLRHHSDHRFIWADAICINQADEEEKSHQVRLMRRIFQRATRVVIWLGDDDETGCGTSSLSDVISQINRRNFPAVPPPENREIWAAVGRLYKSSWFWRVWCLQEAILAPSAQVMLGKLSMPWEHIGFAATWIRDVKAQVFHYEDSALIGINNACLMYGLSHINKSRQHISFLQLLTLTRPFMATDPRDKIYGILGIPTTDSDPDTDDLFLQPDYEKDLSEAYINCSLAIIRRTQSLRLLSYVQHEELPILISDISKRIVADDTLVKVPSWVPRWHQYFARTLMPAEQEPKTFEPSASMNLDSVTKTDVRGLDLVTYGAQITRVKRTSCIFDNSEAWRHTSPETACEVWEQAFYPLIKSKTDPTELLYALSTLLTAGKDWFGGIIQDREQHLADFLAFMYDPAMLIRRHPRPLLRYLFQPRTDLGLPIATKLGHAHSFQEAMRGACTRRRLVFTKDGHVGLGPQVTEPGDVVCILKDAIMPLVLRPEANRDSFKLVGEAYIQGMMFGEIKISEVEQIVISDKPFVDPVETEP